jgi:hypothetical protein
MPCARSRRPGGLPAFLARSSAGGLLLPLLLLASPALTDKARADLLGVRWQHWSQLQALAETEVSLRYVADGVAFISVDPDSRDPDWGNPDWGDPGFGDPRPHLVDLGLTLFLADQASPEEDYFLFDHLDSPRPEGLHLVYLDSAGWGLARVARNLFGQVHREQHFLWPLPERYLLGSSPPFPAAKPTAPLQPSPVVVDLISRVDAARLEAHVAALALIDPAAGSVPGNVRTRYARRPETFEATLYIRDQLAAVLGPEAVSLQEFRITDDDSLMYNVIGDLPGTDPDAGHYIICAHYDAIGSRTRGGWDWRTDPAPGADDNGSGVAVVLESARLLAEQRFPWSIRFIAWSGEELGLWGSKRYAARALERDERIIGVMNFDMVGFNDLRDRLELITNPQSLWLVELMRRANERYDVGLQIDVLEDPNAILSDHAPFWVRGYDAVLGIENYLPTDNTTIGVQRGDYRLNTQYHSVADLPDSINWELVARVTRLTVGSLAQLGLEDGLPNLAVFGSDLTNDRQDDLRLRVSNLGSVALESSYRVRVSRCGADSASCAVFYEEERPAFLAAGAVDDITIPWGRFGNTVFLVEIDVDDRVTETSEQDNRVFQAIRLLPQSDIVIYPNPFNPGGDAFLSFSGLPLRARVRISTLEGTLIWSGAEDDPGSPLHEVRWPGINENSFVSGGVYVYTIRTRDGELLRRDKIAVVR